MNIKELRASLNLSQSQFAEKLGMDRSDIGKMENGKKNISARTAEKIREVFGVEPGLENLGKKLADKVGEKATVKEAEKPAGKKTVKKITAPDLEIYIQSPLGGNITPEEIRAMMPEGTESCYVRVDQNRIWWLKGDGSTGSVEIWQ